MRNYPDPLKRPLVFGDSAQIDALKELAEKDECECGASITILAGIRICSACCQPADGCACEWEE